MVASRYRRRPPPPPLRVRALLLRLCCPRMLDARCDPPLW